MILIDVIWSIQSLYCMIAPLVQPANKLGTNNSKDTKAMMELVQNPQWRHWNDVIDVVMLVSIVEFERFWHFDLLALLLAFKMFFFAGKIFCILIDSLHVSLMTAFIFILRLRVISSLCIFIQLKNQPSQHFLVQSQKWKHKNNLWNLFKVKNIMKLLEPHQWRRSGVFIFNFEKMSHIVLFPLLTFNK